MRPLRCGAICSTAHLHTPVKADFTCLWPSLNYGVIVTGNARLGGLTHVLHSNFKDLINVHDGGFFFFPLSVLQQTLSIWKTSLAGWPWWDHGSLRVSYFLIPSPANKSLGFWLRFFCLLTPGTLNLEQMRQRSKDSQEINLWSHRLNPAWLESCSLYCPGSYPFSKPDSPD